MTLNLSLLTCGVWHATFERAKHLMPDVAPILDSCPVQTGTLDIKVHMLMPGQYPCIPGWHFDFVPRVNGKPDLSLRDPSQEMYLYLSGNPLPEFRDGRKVEPCQWVKFTQFDEHKGNPATEHGWRLFVRVVPETLCKPAKPGKDVRRHTQVYLDAANFSW